MTRFASARWSAVRAVMRWGALVGLSLVLIAALEWARMPGALLLGSLVAAAALSLADVAVSVPPPLFAVAQAVVGLLIARVVQMSTVHELARDWPVFASGVLSVVVAAAGLGWLLARLRVLPGTTAVWGAFPGAATVMTLMSEGFGADMRLVALMQYLRVVLVTVAASAVSSFWMTAQDGSIPSPVWFPAIAWPSFAATVALALASAAVGVLFEIPAGPMLVALGAGAAAHISGVIRIELPLWLLAPAYCVVGWAIGARFSRPIIGHAARALPGLTASILALIVVCGGLAALLVRFAHVDALTAYLAMSPGGADSVAIIAASTHVDMPFVMAMQMARFLFVLSFGPMIARLIARIVGS